jgi:hypothetical protein
MEEEKKEQELNSLGEETPEEENLRKVLPKDLMIPSLKTSMKQNLKKRMPNTTQVIYQFSMDLKQLEKDLVCILDQLLQLVYTILFGK